MELSETGRLLIVDDEPVVRDSLRQWFRTEGYEVGVAATAPEALGLMARHRWDLALVDIKMPGVDGVDLERRLREVDPALTTVMMTGPAFTGSAVAALTSGAYDYVLKPFQPEVIAHTIRRALAHRRAEQHNVRQREALAVLAGPEELIGQSPAMKRVFEAISAAGSTEANVLICGESGTGKELVARAIHMTSPRRLSPFVVVHLSAPAGTRSESELSGLEKEACTTAHTRKGGLEIADGGTVFLDGIAGISLTTQARLLPFLEDREIRHGDGKHLDLRVIAATCHDLEGLVDEGKLRPDLFYRLNLLQIALPPLRERKEDIPLLVEHFVREYVVAMNKKTVRVAPKAMKLLQQYDWPGNVRELKNAVERAMIVSQSAELGEEDFTLKLACPEAAVLTWEDAERTHILRILDECGGSQKRAAQTLAIHRVTLHKKLKSYGWKRPRAKNR